LTIEETLGQTFLGAPVGSALFAVAIAAPLLLNAGGFTVAALLVLTLRGSMRPQRSGEPTTIRRDMVDGVRWLVRHRFLRGLTVISALTSAAQSMVNGVLVLYVLEELRLPSGNFGFVLLAAGVGGLLGGVNTPALARRFGRGRMLVLGAVVSAVATGAMGLTRNGFLGAALFAASAAGVMVWNVLTMSLRQALIPQQLFGRVQGAYRTVVWGAIPIGAIAGGLLGSAAGIRPVFFVGGAGMLLCAGFLARLVGAHRAELDDPATPSVAEPPLPTTVH
jgi:MFS family permease